MQTSTTAKGGRVGDMLPDITLPRLEGGEVALRELRGNRLLLFFWGSW